MAKTEALRMADDSKDEANYPFCGVTCSTSGCSLKCCKENTPTHAAYGIHACLDHK